MTGKKGNLRNIATGEVVVSEETREEVESELYWYLHERVKSETEYLLKGEDVLKD